MQIWIIDAFSIQIKKLVQLEVIVQAENSSAVEWPKPTFSIWVIQKISDGHTTVLWGHNGWACVSIQIVRTLFIIINCLNETVYGVLNTTMCTGTTYGILGWHCCSWLVFIDLLLVRCHAHYLVVVWCLFGIHILVFEVLLTASSRTCSACTYILSSARRVRFSVDNWLCHFVSIPPGVLKSCLQEAELGQMDSRWRAIWCSGLGLEPACDEAFHTLSASTGFPWQNIRKMNKNFTSRPYHGLCMCQKRILTCVHVCEISWWCQIVFKTCEKLNRYIFLIKS